MNVDLSKFSADNFDRGAGKLKESAWLGASRAAAQGKIPEA